MEDKQKLLDNIMFPSDLKKVPEDKLIQLCAELRELIIDECSTNPGHLGAGLGVVELTVALHYVLNTPYDNLIWDVGHQAYGHKILTGRKDLFKSNRKLHGISGFPKMSESEYDSFGTGHSSTSVSAALGMAVAAEQMGETDRNTVAVIGDGSMTGGMAFEALNNAGANKANLLVILNDNNMAIDPNVGGLNNYLLDIATSKTYNKIKNDVWHVLGLLNRINPKARKFVQKIDNSIKSLLLKQSNMFEALGFRYFGPVDGHDVNHLVKTLESLMEIPGPKLLHCITKKGKGYKFAEEEQTIWHAPGKFDKSTGEIIKSSTKNEAPKYQDVFGHTITELARNNNKIVGITPAMPTGCSLNIMMKEFPERTFDVGIAEQHAVTFSAGMAAKGMQPFCNIYSSFMQRAYDQVIHDTALQNLNVVFCLDRGGLVGADGATHHGAYDLAYFRCIPNMTVAAPMDEQELKDMMYTAQLPDKGPFSIRYPRGKGTGMELRKEYKELPIGKGRCIKEGEKVAVISIGTIGNEVAKAFTLLKGINPAHYDMRFLKPIDEELLHRIAGKFSRIITVEDGTVKGGLGSAVAEFITTKGYNTQIDILGIPDQFIEQGTQQELYEICGYDAASVARKINSIYE